MPDRAVFIGFGQPVRGREERAVEVFNEFVGMFGRMQADGRIEDMDVTLLDPHGGDLGGFFMVHGSAEQCSALHDGRGVPPRLHRREPDRRRTSASCPPRRARRSREEMTMYTEAVQKVGVGGHALAGV